MAEDTLYGVIDLLGDSPEDHLAAPLREECKSFKESDDPIDFLRNLRDKVVNGGAGSNLTMHTLNAFLEPYPETREEAHLRRERVFGPQPALEPERPPPPPSKDEGFWRLNNEGNEKTWVRSYNGFQATVVESRRGGWTAYPPWYDQHLLPKGVIQGPFDTKEEAILCAEKMAAEELGLS